jgi:dTDP-L-rhamnose 4-epimerase
MDQHMMQVLITGGAGFIGTNLARRLVHEGCQVTLFDNFNPQIHGDQRRLPDDLDGQVRLIVGDVRDRQVVRQALNGQEVVVHLAAETGTGQSMYEVERYTSVNIGGTATLVDSWVNDPHSHVRKIVLASSRAVYGEGKYQCSSCSVVYPAMRQAEDLGAGQFEPLCPRCGAVCHSLPTDEDSPLQASSLYGLTKQAQEQMLLLFARSLGQSAFILRYQNVYGPGQSMKNPYTGILTIFANQARAGQPIRIFEDGQESRDFIYIEDAVEATWRCIRPETTGIEIINVGSGESVTVSDVARQVVRYFGDRSEVSITGEFRLGDIRHSLADLTRARQRLGFTPRWTFAEGVKEFLRWADAQAVGPIPYEQSLAEMRARGLMHG